MSTSTQDATGIAFSSSHQKQAFRLLELPPELLQLLESDNPPTLYIKSAVPSLPTAHALAILCSPDKTYRIQQKNTSNPIMVLEPCFSSILQSDDQESGMACPAVHAIATVEDTLELYAQDSEANASGSTKVNKWHERFAKGRAGGKPKN